MPFPRGYTRTVAHTYTPQDWESRFWNNDSDIDDDDDEMGTGSSVGARESHSQGGGGGGPHA